MRCQALLLGFLSFAAASEDGPLVKTKTGQLKGVFVQPDDAQAPRCGAFLGVPFAEPPIGALRFERPSPKAAWEGVRDADAFGPQCLMHPTNFGFVPPAGQSEDCLYLDVTLPPGHDIMGPKKPVMVWIHGGGFVVGNGGPSYRPSEMCDGLAARDVLVVTLQYRLGLFGFLATKGAPTNVGMWDQVQALRWVRDNIGAFGGDKDQVTIFGESAGGSSVSWLTHAPVAERLFARAIAQSGASVSYWASGDVSKNSTRDLLQRTECDDVECLRALSVEELMGPAEAPMKFRQRVEGKEYRGGGYNVLAHGAPRWAPHVDGDLFPGEEAALSQLKPKPYMTGTTSQESILFLLSPVLEEIEDLGPESAEPFRVADDSVYEETFLENLQAAGEIFVGDPSKGKVAEAIARMARFVYLDQQGFDGVDRAFLTGRLLDLFSDVWGHLPCLQDADLKKRHGWTVWLYNFDYVVEGAPHFPSVHRGAGHAEELYLLFRNFGLPFNVTLSEKDHTARRHIITLWTNFAKHGNPSYGQVGSSSLKWPPYQSLAKPTHLVLSEAPSVSDDFHPKTLPFWTTMAPHIHNSLKNNLNIDKTEL